MAEKVETPSVFQKRTTRRRFLKGLVRGAAAVGFATGTGAGLILGLSKADQRESGNSLVLSDEPLGEPAEYLTSAAEGKNEMLWPVVRRRTNLGNELGVTQPGIKFEGQPVRGVTYKSWMGMGNEKDQAGSYGVWLKGEFPLYDEKTKQPKVDSNGKQIVAKGYIAGHFASIVKSAK